MLGVDFDVRCVDGVCGNVAAAIVVAHDPTGLDVGFQPAAFGADAGVLPPAQVGESDPAVRLDPSSTQAEREVRDGAWVV